MENQILSVVEFTVWLLQVSGRTSVVIGLVLLAQWLFQKKLTPRWRYCLWSLVVIRLMLPVSPESVFSIFNYTQGVPILARGTGAFKPSHVGGSGSQAMLPVVAPATSASVSRVSTTSSPAANSDSSNPPQTRLGDQRSATAPIEENKTETGGILASSVVVAPTAPPSIPTRVPNPQQMQTADQPAIGVPTEPNQIESTRASLPNGPNPVSAKHWSGPLMISSLWLVGVLFLLTRVIWFPLRLNAQLAQHETATGPAVFEILEQAKRLMGMRKVVPIVQSRAVASPALLGFIRPWLLLPDGMVEQFTPQELRFVFLHELAHLKRRDIAVNWLMTILQILHWFNPLVWLAFSRMRADRELACDELALSFAKADENKSYGQAIIKLLEGFTRPTVLPGLVGILEDKKQMKRRITMIAQFKQITQWSAVAVALLLALGLVTLTDAQSGKGTEEQTANSNRRVSAKALFQVWACPVEVVPSSTSSDGRYLSYIDYNTGNIGVRDLVAGVSRALTKGSWELMEFGDVPAISPDGKDVAYGWFNKDTYELRIVGLDGATPRVFYQNPEVTYYHPFAWSPDKKFVVTTFYRKDGTRQLALVSPQDGSTRILKSFGWSSANSPSFSPDGRWILYSFQTKEDVKQEDIFVLATDGSREIPLVQGPANDVSPIWTPDGKHVLFVSDRGGSKGLWLIEVNDGQPQGTPRLIKPDVGSIDPLGMTEKGSFYHFMLVGQNDVYTTDLDLTTGRLASTPQLVSQRFVGFNSTPAWSPDGESIAYLATRSGAIVIHSFKTDEERELPTKMSFRFELAWSPDGRMLLASASDAKGRGGIYQIDAQTGKTSLVVQGGRSSTEARTWGWFPDGKSIFYNRGGIVRRNLETEEEQEIFIDNPDGLRFVTLSPDGRQFAAWTGDASKKQEILLIPTDKSKPRELLRVDDAVSEQTIGRTPPGLAWTPDGKHVVFGKRVDRDRSTELWRANIESGKPEKIGTVTNRVHGIVVHPNRNRIAYSTREDKFEVWAMENFLPKDKMAGAREAKPAVEYNTEPIVKTLVSGTGAETGGVLSPDESKVAYTDFSSVSGDLAVKDLRTGTITKLTSHDTKRTSYVYEIAMNLVWSPDSKWIAYTFLNDTNFSVRLAPAEGGDSKVLKENPEILYWPFDWSQDGKSLLCNLQKSWDKSMSLGMVSTETGEVRQLISLEWNGLDHARFSPDGKFIVYDREENENKDIFVLALEGMRVHRLTDLPSSEDSPVWSRDGKLVLFTSDRTGQKDLWGIAVRNGEAVDAPFLLKRSFGGQDYRMTRNGKLAFTRPGGAGTDCYYFDVNPSTGDINGSPKLITTTFYGRQKCPAYSPDGLKVAYIRDRNPLCIQSLADGKVEMFKTDMQYFDRIFWSPDSKTVALQGRGRTGPLGIHLLSLETRQVTQLFAGQEGVGEPRGFSADGKEFYFGKDGKRIAVEVATRRERTMEFPKHEDYNYSPDGKRIAYVEREPNGPERRLIVSDSEFKEPKIIDRGEGQFLYRRWSPDGKMIAYNYNAKRGTQQWGTELRVSAADGSWQKTPKTGKLKIFSTGHAPSWSADGTKLALTLSEEGPGEIGVLENFLPKEKVAAAGEAKAATEPNVGAVVRTLLTGGVLAPDEGKVAFEEWSGNATAVFVKDLKTGITNKLTNVDPNTPGFGAVIGSELVWSPDSKQVAYCWIWYDENNDKSTNNGNDLRIVSASGGQFKVIKSHNPGIQFNPTDWSTDGQSLLCELKKKDGTVALATVSIESGEVRQLLSFPWETRPRHPRFSPDGKSITYERTENGNRDVYVLAVEGTQASRLTDWPSEEGSPIWSPDGKHVLFSSNRSGAWELLGIEVRNGKAVERAFVIRSDFGDRAKRITRSGNLAFDLSRGGGSDVYLIEVNPATGLTGSPKLVTKSFYGQHLRPAWSSDGKKLAYLRKRQEGTAPLLCVMSLADGREESFETGMRYMNSVFMSPDGKSAALSPRGKSDQYGIHLFSMETHELRPLVLSDDFRPRGFTADGKEFLLFQAGNRNEHVAVEVMTGKERMISFGEKLISNHYDLSPDGSRIVYVTNEPGSKRQQLVLANIDFKVKQVIARATKPGDYTLVRPRWSPDGTKITYNEGQKLRIRAVDGRWERAIDTGNLELFYWPEWSPDSTKLALTLAEPGVSEIGILENFLPKTKLAAK